MRNHQGRDTALLLNFSEFLTNRRARPSIQCGKRFVKQQKLGIRRKCSSNGRALLLPARQFIWIAVGKPVKMCKSGQFIKSCSHFAARGLPMQTVKYIFLYRQIGKKRIVLKDNTDTALF